VTITVICYSWAPSSGDHLLHVALSSGRHTVTILCDVCLSTTTAQPWPLPRPAPSAFHDLLSLQNIHCIFYLLWSN